jgi:hypothetical protein
MQKMPRFSDIFVYESSSLVSDRIMQFTNCYLLKKVHDTLKRVDSIVFDMDGMVLFFFVGTDKYGPYVLTTTN